MVMIAFLLIGLPAVLVCLEFIYYLSYSRGLLPPGVLLLAEVLYIIVFPVLFLLTTERVNNCCSGSAFFSPEHSLTMYSLIVLCAGAYFYSSQRSSLGGPLLELILNCLLIVAITLNIFSGFHHAEEDQYLIIIHIPIILLYIIIIVKNQRLFLNDSGLSEKDMESSFQKLAWRILHLNIFKKIPLLILICLPVLALLAACLLLLGQKPDSAIRAFTDTYKHGFSQLDYQCVNAICPEGHFLCTIAAKGHKKIVNPLRLGWRGGNLIVCNRQLLVSNAFEELIQQKLPSIHKPVRKFYNQVGNYIHRYYGAFNYKWVSDGIYFLMKPLEWFFLIILYLADRQPEIRIARQYLDKNDEINLNRNAAKS